jgi:proline iminopeptidase
MPRPAVLCAAVAVAACHAATPAPRTAGTPRAPTPSGTATLARIYFWRAQPGRLEEYSRYIRESAEPIDHEAQRRGAFLSITTTVNTDTARPWTHMRVFMLRDEAQLEALGKALDDAGVALEPDSVKRQARSWYNTTLRDLVGQATVDLENGQLAYIPLPGFDAAPVREGWIAGFGGVRLFYRLVGLGRDTVVFVHGGPATGMREGYDFEPLTTQGHALLMYDQRGAGMSELVVDPARLGLRDHAADLGAILDHFHLRKARLIGLSWGAAIVAQFAAEHPDAVDRIAFVSPISPTQAFIRARFAHLDSVAGRPDAGGLAGRLRAAAAPIPDSLVQQRCHADRADDRLYRAGGPHAVRPRGDPCDYPVPVLRNRVLAREAGLASLDADYDLTPTLGRVRAPALVLEGERTNVPLDATRAFAAALAHALLVLIPDAGHQSWLDRPDAVLPTLDAFMSGR